MIPIAEEAGPRFCRACGEPWIAGAVECAACLQRVARRAAAGPLIDRHQLRSPLGLYFSLLAFSIAGIVAIVAGADELTTQMTIMVGQAIVVIVWCLVAERESLRVLIRPAALRWLGAGLGIGIVTFGLASAVIHSLHAALGLEVLRYSKSFLDGGYGWSMVFLMMAIQPAIIEELAFRGVVLGSLKPALSDTEAILVSAGLFMILHLTPAAFPHTFAMGIAAGLLRLRSGSLLPGVLLHLVHNSLCLGVEWLDYG